MTSPFVINKAMVLAFSEMGKGYEASNKLSSVTNMSGLAKQSFNQHIKKVANANADVGASVLRVSAEAVREAYKDLGNHLLMSLCPLMAPGTRLGLPPTTGWVL